MNNQTNEMEETTMNNIEKLTARLNACKNPRKIYDALMALAGEPGVQHVKDPAEKFDVLFGQLAAIPDEAESA